MHHHIPASRPSTVPRQVQQPVAPQIIDKGMPAPELIVHVLVSRFVDHLPYYRKEDIKARSNVHTSRSRLASWLQQCGTELQPIFDVHRGFILGADVLDADETPVRLSDPGAGKTMRACAWAPVRCVAVVDGAPTQCVAENPGGACGPSIASRRGCF